MDNPRQITKYQNNKVLICFNDNLQVTDGANASSVHNNFSKIRVFAQDYSKGTGEKNVMANVNIDPDTMKYIAELILSGVSANFVETKILGHKKDDSGKSPVTKFSVKYCIDEKTQQPLSVPWMFSVENGVGIAEITAVGGTMCKKGSYAKTSDVRIYMSEVDCYKTMITIRDYIRAFEIIHLNGLLKAREQYEIARKAQAESDGT